MVSAKGKVKKNFRKTYKKAYKKNYKKNYKSIPQGFPMSTVAKLRYCETGSIDPEAGVEKVVYSANGMFDPTTAVGGHQPLGFDQYAVIYDHYVVLGSKIHVVFWTENAATTYASIVGIKLDDDDALSTTNPQTVIEQPARLTKWKMLRNNSTSGDQTIVDVYNSYSAKKFNGIKDVKDNKSWIGASCAANPTEMAYYILFAGHPDGATDLPDIKYQVIIDYIVQFSELKNIPLS